jgi:hypothetical protein
VIQTPVRAGLAVGDEPFDSYANQMLAVVRHEGLVLPRYVVEFEMGGMQPGVHTLMSSAQGLPNMLNGLLGNANLPGIFGPATGGVQAATGFHGGGNSQ